MRILRLHLGLVLLLPMTIVPVGKLSAGERHAGIVLSVAADSLVIDELGRAGKAHQLRVTVTPRTGIILSQRDPQELEFTDTPISLAQVKKGDFVGVDTSHEGSKIVAASITVTLRQERPIRPEPNGAAPPPTIPAAQVSSQVQPQEEPRAPTVPVAPDQLPASDNANDPRAVIDWLLYPASARTR